MTNLISTRDLAKEYILGETHAENMLRGALVGALKRPFKRQQRTCSRSFWALKGVSLDISEGEVVGIVGRNGAGKSTFLKLLSRITYPTRGSLSVVGRIGALLEVGTGFHPEMSGRENIFLNGSILGMSRKEIRAKLDAIVDFSGVEEFIDTPIKRYSSGMGLRLGFAVAAHLEPDILLIDEVLAVGDAEFQSKCLRKLGELQSSGRTVLFVSHNLAAVENLCHRVIWIDDGRVCQDGKPQDVINAYLTKSSRLGGEDVGLNDADRGGQGGIRFTRLQMLADGQPATFGRSGQELTFRLHYKVESRVRCPHFGLKIYSDLGTLLSEVSTWASGTDIRHLEPGQGSIDLTINQLNLMPNFYYLSLWCASVGGIWYDVLDRCVRLEVTESDVYGSGRGIHMRHGVLVLDCRWHSLHTEQAPTSEFAAGCTAGQLNSTAGR
jgi:lipopolysaccharide transport system ATP-binding protein